MKALLVVAHGSRRTASNEEVRDLTSRLRETVEGFAYLDCAFLELAAPSIPDGIRKAIENGATEVVVVPYFLSAGRHVVEDIPAEIEIVQKEAPNVIIKQAPYLGAADEIGSLLYKQALGAD